VNGKERLFSERLACPNDGSSIPELEPRSFSFNSPYGACEVCNGIGSTWAFDPAKVIADPSKPLLDGGLGPGSSSSYMQASLNEAADTLGIDLSVPFDLLPKRTRTMLLEGNTKFEGILNILNESFEQASEGYREWLMEFMSATECAACRGRRLKPASLAVKVKGVSIAEFTEMPLARALPLVRSWKFSERELQIVGRVAEEIGDRLEFLHAVGLDYLSLARSSATLSGARRSGYVWRRRSARSCAACSMCWMSPQSDYTREITIACSIHCTGFATWATRCWW
jgi:excinuclease ABC subunit A